MLTAWPQLQRRFAEQHRPSLAPDKLVRAIRVAPIDAAALAWSSFHETGAVPRSASLSRDFKAVATLAGPVPCFLLIYVGDVTMGAQASGAAPSGKWVLASYTPQTGETSQGKKLREGRAALKAKLGEQHFGGEMWCSSKEQLSLSHYMKSREITLPIEMQGDDKAARIQAIYRGNKSRAYTNDQRAVQGTYYAYGSRYSSSQSNNTSDGLVDELWEQRLRGVRSGYVESCQRLCGALEELERTLSSLTGEGYSDDEPLLHARVHMKKKLQSLHVAQAG